MKTCWFESLASLRSHLPLTHYLSRVLQKRLSIDNASLSVLSGGSFNSVEDIRRITTAALRLQEVFNFTRQPGNEDYEGMAAVREKINEYKEHQAFFSARLHDALEGQIEILSENYLKEKDRFSRKGDLKLVSHEQAKVSTSFLCQEKKKS